MSSKQNIGQKEDARALFEKLDLAYGNMLFKLDTVVQNVRIDSDEIRIQLERNASFSSLYSEMDEQFKDESLDSVRKFSNVVRKQGNLNLYDYAHKKDDIRENCIILETDKLRN